LERLSRRAGTFRSVRTVRGRALTDVMASSGHEQVVFVADADVGLRAVIAVHSTVLGPSLGGVRFWHYDSDTDALADALRLSEAMTLKAAMAGLDQGGGKAVVRWDEPDRARPEALLEVLGRAIDDLGGRYIAAEDVGATPADMNALARFTPWVTGVDASIGGSGDPSPLTAFGVLCAMRAVTTALDGDPSLRDRAVVVQGAGHVGVHLTRLLVAEGARVTVADVLPVRAQSLADELGVQTVPHDRALTVDCDLLAPCALGGVLDATSIPHLRCRAVVGAANNQLAAPGLDRMLADLGILYAPDFVVNAGGIINVAEEFVGYDRMRAEHRTAVIQTTTTLVLQHAREHGTTPQQSAVLLARRRIADAGDGKRWQPGDPAAWTEGQPLRSLRPDGSASAHVAGVAE
jgi:glutamate dehydrogenase/leucine dehydrogenase